MTDEKQLTLSKARRNKKQQEDIQTLGKVPGFAIVAGAIMNDPYNYVARPDHKIKLVKINDIHILCRELPRQVLRQMTELEVSRLLLNYIEKKLLTEPDLAPTFETYDAQRYRQLIEYLLVKLPVIEDVKPLRFLSEDGYCWDRLDFDLLPSSYDSTALDGFLRRCSDSEAVIQFIGSLFVDSPREQYLWMYGDGGDGKSTVVRFLSRLMGSGYRGRTVPQPTDRFWTSSIIGARLVAFNDTNNYGFPATGLFKSLTGGDLVQIERKGKDIENAKIDAKFIFTSNERPRISSERADRRRAIYVEIQPLPADEIDEHIDQKLWDDRQKIVSLCVENYLGNCDKHGKIKTNTTLLDDLIEENESEFSAIFEKWFVFEKEGTISAARLTDILKRELKNSHEITQWRQWLRRLYDVKPINQRCASKVLKIYPGIREKTAVEKVPE